MKRTGTSLFFDLDVTHLRSADANRGWYEMLEAELVSLEQSTQGVAGALEPLRYTTKYLAEPGRSVERNKSIYHLLCRAFGQCVSVPEIVDFDVFDVIAVCDINFAVNIAGTLARGGGGSLGRRAQCLHIQVSMASGKLMSRLYRSNRRNIHMLDAFSGLEFRIDLRCSCGCERKWLAKLLSHDMGTLPAAAAGSNDADFLPSEEGLFTSLAGLRLRRDSLVRDTGERERRSKRDVFLSGSV